MGFSEIAKSSAELWHQYENEFPVRKHLVYFNHAGVAPLCRPAADAMQRLSTDCLEFGSFHYQDWMDTYEGVRAAAARLVGADSKEIAIVKNTSEGIATVAMGLNWRSGDKVVAFKEEFPANVFPWKRLESKGIRVEWLSFADPLERIDQACRGARLLAISFVQYLSGYRADLESIGEICHRHGCIFLVDAIQGLGAFPLNVRKARIHAFAADGHKWMLGSEGCGILYISQDLQESVEPVEFGWTNVAKYADYASRDMALRPDAGRYECGTLNTIGCYGLRASIQFLLQVGVERIAPAVQRLADRVADGAQGKGYEVLGKRSPATGAGIVSIRKPGIESHTIVRRLQDAGIITAPRQGWVRVSPHFYQSPDEVDRFVETLP
ncbi:MAG: aminotransferase class V-fold PLP-dependent enzyme [Bryobacteraceae bacterium]